MNSNDKSFNKLLLILSMVIFGTVGIVNSFIMLPTPFVVFTRAVLGSLFLIAVLIVKRQKFDFASVRSNLFILILSGLFLGLNWICLFFAFEKASVSVGTLLYYLAPVYLLLLSPLLFKEKLTLKNIICALVALFGMVLVSGVFESFSLSLTGIIFGILSSFFYAGVMICNKKITGVNPIERTVVQFIVSAFVSLPCFLITNKGAPLSFSTQNIIALLVIGFINTGIAYMLYFGSMPKLDSKTISVIVYIDPVVALIFSFVVLKEKLSILGLIGAFLIIGSLLISEITPKNSQN